MPEDKSDALSSLRKEATVFLSADYSQIELRILAHFFRDVALITAFQQDKDIHTVVASPIYNVPIERVTSETTTECKGS